MPRTTTLLAVAVALCACSEHSSPEQRPAPTPGGAASVPDRAAHHFDAGALAPGDTFLDLRVVRLDVARVFEDSVWSGAVQFAGEAQVRGVYQRHFDYPEPAALCFHVTDDESTARLPDFAPDAWTSPNAKRWLCFTNTDDVTRLLGTGAEPVAATVVIDDYVNRRIFSDVFDTARLVRVTAIHGSAQPTLRLP
jgi:hypothetical protein